MEAIKECKPWNKTLALRSGFWPIPIGISHHWTLLWDHWNVEDPKSCEKMMKYSYQDPIYRIWDPCLSQVSLKISG